MISFDEEKYTTRTSAGGPMAAQGLRASLIVCAFFLTSGISEAATGSANKGHIEFERTGAGPTGQVDSANVQNTADAVLEIRRLSGLTWDELSDLFDVSRRSVHHWASGKALSSKHDRMIRQILTVIRHHNRGSSSDMRALLLTVGASGVSIFEQLKEGAFASVMLRTEPRLIVEPRRIPLSKIAQDARRLPAPALLIDADQERADIPTKARLAQSVRVLKAG